ncbi:MAG: tRNA (adenosine(37)-N6)-dimethylallyltransferase MiaA [Patescibacteria group bacterium]|nr:MAG: tRNA (adenosine(37)-N6)-dimethylallyltransferase MiaA [Patescibacteria group bacterium]
MKPLPRIIVIVGPTASGKSSLALKLAKALDGEIVSADSRLLYRGMDIGTAKPTRKEREKVPHHLIDVVPPSKTLTLAEYKRKALQAIRGIVKRGRLPIVVGGTGLYVRALVENLEIPEVPPDPEFRASLRKKGTAWILARVKKLDPEYAARIGPNPRFATRALEVIKATGKPFSAQQGRGAALFDALVLGLDPGKAVLKRRIVSRVASMFRSGLAAEAKRLADAYDEALPSMSGIGYRELWPYVRGEISLAEAKKTIAKNTEAYAKRQMTWWRGMEGIAWHERPETAMRAAKKWLMSAKVSK